MTQAETQENVEVVPEQLSFSERVQNVARYALAGTAATVAFFAPAVGVGIEAVTHGPATHVPMKIAGADVTARIKPGSDADSFSLFETTFTDHSNHDFGGKPFGVRVKFDFSHVDATITQVLEQVSDTKAQRSEIETAIEKTAKRNFEAGFGGTLALELGAVGYAWSRRRKYARMSPDQAQQIRNSLKVERRMAYGALATLALVVTNAPIVEFMAPDHTETIVADPDMQGTPFEGMSLAGLGRQALDPIMPHIAPLLREKTEYSKNAEANIKAAFAKEYPDGITKDPNTFTIIAADDFQGIDVTTGSLGLIAHLYKADAILIGGDTLESAEKFETNVVDGLAYIRSKYKIPIILATGRHDSLPVLRSMAKPRGLTIANDRLQEIHGIRFLGVNDATRDLPGTPSTLVHKGVTNADKAASAIKLLCAQPIEKPVIAFGHDSKQLGTPIAASGCSPSVIFGRHIKPHDPINVDGRTIQDFMSSSGGHTPDGFSVYGLPQSMVYFTDITFNKNTYQQVVSQVITQTPDVTAKVIIKPPILASDLPVTYSQRRTP